jgi:stress response protein SCP2
MTDTLTPGGNSFIPGSDMTLRLTHGTVPGADIDVSAFPVTTAGKVRSDEEMCFYAAPDVLTGALRLVSAANGETVFQLNTSALPDDIVRVVFAATIHENKATFASTAAIRLDISSGAHAVKGEIPTAGRTETALMMLEVYRRNGDWKIRVIGQGFEGGLAPLARHHGVEVDDAPAAAPQSKSNVDLEKRLISLEKKDAKLVSLVKAASISLKKKNVDRDRARVFLCLDISGSMSSLYSSGKIDQLVQRVMALGYRLDDDGMIDVILFGAKVHEYGQIGVDDYKGFVTKMTREYRLEGGTRYGAAMEVIRRLAAEGTSKDPVYVMFVTDGGTDDKPKTERMLREAADEPIFWKFMALGGKGRFAQARFEFLEKLDDMAGRTVDNADFFQVDDPTKPSDEEMFDLMMEEYGDWQRAAIAAGILKV